MARIRQIKPEFFKSEDVAGLEWPARMLFIGLWTIAAADGRLLDRPRRIAAELFPYDHMEERIDLLLGMLAARELIVRYIAQGKPCIQIVNFAKHQKPHIKEPDSGLPAPPNQPPQLTPPRHSEEFREVTDDDDPGVGQSPDLPVQAEEEPGENDTSRSGSLGSGSLGSGSLEDGESALPAPARSHEHGGVTMHEPITSVGIVRAFATVRAKIYPSVLPWSTPRSSWEKVDPVVDGIAADPASAADVLPTMFRFFEQVRAGDVSEKAAKDPTYGFACWAARFTALREDLHGVSPVLPAARGSPQGRSKTAGNIDVLRAWTPSTTERTG